MELANAGARLILRPIGNPLSGAKQNANGDSLGVKNHRDIPHPWHTAREGGDMNIVRQSIQRADPQVIEKLGQAGVATVHEAMGNAD